MWGNLWPWDSKVHVFNTWFEQTTNHHKWWPGLCHMSVENFCHPTVLPACNKIALCAVVNWFLSVFPGIYSQPLFGFQTGPQGFPSGSSRPRWNMKNNFRWLISPEILSEVSKKWLEYIWYIARWIRNICQMSENVQSVNVIWTDDLRLTTLSYWRYSTKSIVTNNLTI